ncbi:hypothetical protein E2562_006601 [Oryza meyeriana var. granulata]|uniref:Uncharacterized protein n=1 Tax=Oryza meyeriana var. granulata TaxID=110450 RepID=A0A6G1EGT4_9ORYZ|nr:hypothetical protein E2562_006601 [Oryza meyeriana var. granulata]
MEQQQLARALWDAAKHMFRNNHETSIIYQEIEFRSLNQGDMFVMEYCRRLKNLADSLWDLGKPISNRTLVLNLICGLSSCFSTGVPFPMFATARSALLLAEMRHPAGASSDNDTALFTSPFIKY